MNENIQPTGELETVPPINLSVSGADTVPVSDGKPSIDVRAILERTGYKPSVKQIRVYGDPLLWEKSQPVTEFDDDLIKLVADMAETMYPAGGTGLAAVQIGVPVRVIMIDTVHAMDETKAATAVLVNPILTKLEDFTPIKEYCLSVPRSHAFIKRATTVSVQYQTVTGKTQTLENAHGMLALALQHEIDHLDGICFPDKLPQFQRQKFRDRVKEHKRYMKSIEKEMAAKKIDEEWKKREANEVKEEAKGV